MACELSQHTLPPVTSMQWHSSPHSPCSLPLTLLPAPHPPQAVVPGGQHAFYVELPDKFHSILGTYLKWACSWVLHEKEVPLGLDLEV